MPDDKYPLPPKFRVRGVPALQSALNKISDYLLVLRNNPPQLTASALAEVLQPGPGIGITNQGGVAVVEAIDLLRFRQINYRIFVETPEDDVWKVKVGPGLLYGGKDTTRSFNVYWPDFHSTNTTKPDDTEFALTDGTFEFWGKVTCECQPGDSGASSGDVITFSRPVKITEFKVEKYGGVYSEGINTPLQEDGSSSDMLDIGASVPPDDYENGVFYFYIGCLEKSGDRIRINNAIKEPVWWWMVCGGNEMPSGSGSGSAPSYPSSSSPSPSSSPSGSGSSKDTAIVEDPTSPTGFSALYVVEAPEVLFIDFMEFPVTGKVTRASIEPRFYGLCERAGQKVLVSGDIGWAAARIRDGQVTIRVSAVPWLRPSMVTVGFILTRKCFKGVRLQPKTVAQYHSNERLLQRLQSE